MENMLNELYLNKQYASFYTDAESPDSFIFGWVLGLDDDVVSLGMFTPFGIYDGVRTLRRCLIFKIEYGDEYGKAMQLLVLHHHKTGIVGEVQEVSGDQYRFLLNYAKSNNKLVSVALNGNQCYDVIGFVKHFSSGEVTFVQINGEGFEDGLCSIPVDDISEIQCDTEDERRRELLYRIRERMKSLKSVQVD